MERLITWLDRWRHVIALLIAAVISPLAVWKFSDATGLDWRIIQILVGVVIAVLVTLAVGTVFAAVIAIAESEHVARQRRKTESVGLPAARVLSARWFKKRPWWPFRKWPPTRTTAKVVAVVAPQQPAVSGEIRPNSSSQ